MAKKLGCASCGGTMKKMAKGGPINKPMTYAKRQTGDSNQHMGIFGMPNIGQGAMDGKTGQMKNGGSTSRAVQPSCKNGYVRSADGGCVKARPVQFKTGGSTFGMLSVKAGIDKNPKPTAADRIVGAKKKMQYGGSKTTSDMRNNISKKMSDTYNKKVQTDTTNAILKEYKVEPNTGKVSKQQLGGMFSPKKRAERKITRTIKKSVKNSGKIIK